MHQSKATVPKVPFVAHVTAAVLTRARSDATVRITVTMVAMKRTVTVTHSTNAGFALTEAAYSRMSVATGMKIVTTVRMKKIVKVL